MHKWKRKLQHGNAYVQKEKEKMKNEILNAINKAIKQLCRTAQNCINRKIVHRCRRHDSLLGDKNDKFSNIYVFVRNFVSKFVCD